MFHGLVASLVLCRVNHIQIYDDDNDTSHCLNCLCGLHTMQCKNIVDEYGALIVHLIASEYTPKQVCQVPAASFSKHGVFLLTGSDIFHSLAQCACSVKSTE